jgi:hypothetical protein
MNAQHQMLKYEYSVRVVQTGGCPDGLSNVLPLKNTVIPVHAGIQKAGRCPLCQDTWIPAHGRPLVVGIGAAVTLGIDLSDPPLAECALAPFPPSRCGIFSIVNRLGY